jgi:hypothetical protein
MTLDPIVLDDLTWDQMTAAIRQRIPAESGGRWTLHAPVDPGITVLELYAALLEERLYWLDRVPDAFTGAVLRLLDLDRPVAARPAGTVLRVTSVPAGGTLVPAGTPFVRDPLSRAAFTLATDVTVLPVADLRLQASGLDRTAELRAGGGVPLLPADQSPGEARITLAMSAPVTAPRGQWLSLLFEFEATDRGRVPAAWSPDAVADVPPPADVGWAYLNANGEEVAFGPDEIDDGTQGLRRSGVVRLRIPDAWRTGGAVAPRDHVVVVRTQRGTFGAPPRLVQLAVNVAAAVHRQVIEGNDEQREALGQQIRTQWLPLPNQHLDLPADSRELLLTAELKLRERDNHVHDWTETGDLMFHGPGDRVFTVDRVAGALRFGDGLTGRIPVPDGRGAGPVAAITWQVGGGAGGNGGLTVNWRTVDGFAVEAENLVPAEGGQDPETAAQARIRVAAQLRERHQAVTRADHETVARETPGVHVARAAAVIGDQPGRSCPVPGVVSVYVIPGVPRGTDDLQRPDFVSAPVSDPGMLRAVRNRLEKARLLGTEVFVREPRYRRTRLRAELAAAPADPAATRARLETELRRYLDPLIGGDDGQGWPLGEPLRPSALLRVAQVAAGSDAQVNRVAIWVPAIATWEDCADVAIGGSELVVLDSLQVRLAGGTR